jgi:hypothetical protein
LEFAVPTFTKSVKVGPASGSDKIPRMSEDVPPVPEHVHVHQHPHRSKTGTADKQDAKDLRNNRALLYLSIFITVLSLAGFFWLAGTLDWRGSKGEFTLEFTVNCYGETYQDTSDQLLITFEKEEWRISFVTLGHKIGPKCKSLDVRSLPAPVNIWSLTGTVTPVPVKVPFDEPPGWSSKRGGTVRIPLEQIKDKDNDSEFSFILDYPISSLLEYTGLSERNVVLRLSCDKCSPNVTPPEGFRIIESSIPAEEQVPYGYWKLKMPAVAIQIPVLLKMRNERLSRLDHILDSSIAVLLGVGVGGIVNAYLALILLRRSHRQRSG